MTDSIFTRIINREIPSDIVFEDDQVIAFHDIQPQAPLHVLVVPKNPEYRNVVELADAAPQLLAHIVEVANKLAAELADGHFRLIFNSGEGTGQTVFHVHAHVLAGGLKEGTLAGN